MERNIFYVLFSFFHFFIFYIYTIYIYIFTYFQIISSHQFTIHQLRLTHFDRIQIHNHKSSYIQFTIDQIINLPIINLITWKSYKRTIENDNFYPQFILANRMTSPLIILNFTLVITSYSKANMISENHAIFIHNLT